jgi:protoheme IX farnesyltransferase
LSRTELEQHGAEAPPSRASAYYELTKPGIAGYVMITAGVAYYVAAHGRVDYGPMIHTLLGTGLATAGALAMNQYVEREVDARMERTRERPLPSGRLRPGEALLFGWTLLVGGLAYLGIAIGWLPSVLTAASAAAYILAYTPLKSRSYVATLVGAVPGAFPALIGWAAATGTVAAGGVALFLIAFLWQLPHVLALAWLLREDYAKVGFFLAPRSDESGSRLAQHMVYHSISLTLVSPLPTILGLTGTVYLIGALGLGVATLVLCLGGIRGMTRQFARRVFVWSLLYQPLFLALLLVDTVRV